MMINRLTTISSRGEVVISKRHAGTEVRIQELETGEFLITPIVAIPKHHQIFFTDEANKRLEQFNEHIKSNVPLKDTDSIFEEIEKRLVNEKNSGSGT